MQTIVELNDLIVSTSECKLIKPNKPNKELKEILSKDVLPQGISLLHIKS